MRKRCVAAVISLLVGIVSISPDSYYQAESSTNQVEQKPPPKTPEQTAEAKKKAEQEKLVKEQEAQKQKSLQLQAGDIYRQIREIEGQITELENEIGQRQQEIDALEAEINQNIQQLLDRMVVQREQQHNYTYLSLLTSSEGVGDFLRRWNALKTLNAYDQAVIDQTVATKEHADLLKQETEQQLTRIEQKRGEIESVKINIEAQLAVVRHEVQSSDAYLESLTTANDNIAEQEEMLRNSVGVDRQAVSDDGPKITNGMWYLPIGKDGSISSLYLSMNYLNQFGVRHYGIDIAAKRGEQVVATAPGYVVAVSRSSQGYGNMVAISHLINGKAYVSLYGHLDTTNAYFGQYVAANQKIGTVGSTGMSTGSHLHFELMERATFTWSKAARNASSIDPLGKLPYVDVWPILPDA